MAFIAIDVAKAQLEFACRPSADTGAVAHDDAGIRALVTRCQALAPTLIVLEATGGCEAAVDALDAHILALFAERVRPAPRALPDVAVQALDALLTRRRQLVERLTAERNRLLIARPAVAGPPSGPISSRTSASSSAAGAGPMTISTGP